MDSEEGDGEDPRQSLFLDGVDRTRIFQFQSEKEAFLFSNAPINISLEYKLPQVVHKRCGADSDMYFGLKYFKEENSSLLASARSFTCQKSRTFSLTRLLKLCLEGGSARRRRGCGRLYWKQRSLI